MSLFIILIALMLIILGIYAGLICLQVHISKNNKRGKFVIPIVLFLLPIVLIIIGRTTFVAVNTQVTTVVEDEVMSAEEYPEWNEETEDGVSTTFGAALGSVIVIPAFLSFPCAVITLIIELVYRSKRNKQVSAEEIIDIQNL